MPNEEKFDLKKYQFRRIHPNISIGMASDRYAGWIGQVYSEGRYTKQIKHRTHKIGEKSFTEEVLPLESVEEYFGHFPILEIDYTFYRPLLDKSGKPTPNYFTLKEYQQYLKKDDKLILKVPQLISAKRLRRGGKFVENETYLNPEMIDDAIEIIMEGVRQRKRMNLIVNNRSGGNAPLIVQQIAKRLQEAEL